DVACDTGRREGRQRGRSDQRGQLFQALWNPDAVGRGDHADPQRKAADAGQHDDGPGVHFAISFASSLFANASVAGGLLGGALLAGAVVWLTCAMPAASPAKIPTARPRCMGTVRASAATPAAVSAARRAAAWVSLGTTWPIRYSGTRNSRRNWAGKPAPSVA